MNIHAIKLPERYRLLDSDPEDPPFLKAYGWQTSGTLCFVKCLPFGTKYAMPYDDPQAVIDDIHKDLGDEQGLIVVDYGTTAAGHRYIYSVVKMYHAPGGVQYNLTMHVDYKDYAFQVQGFFDEWGTTGVRDAMVYAMLSNEGKVEATEEGIKGWNADPYDAAYTHGNRMNCSERKEYDELFPDHPLSEARRFAGELISLN